MNADKSIVIDALRVLKDAPCTVNTVEQAHAQGALNARDHNYSETTLTARFDLGRSRPLFSQDMFQMAENRLKKKVDKLDSLRPDRVTGRHLYFADCAEQALGDLDDDRFLAAYETSKNAMKTHAESYQDLTMHQKQHYEDLARLALYEFGRGVPCPIGARTFFYKITHMIW